MAELVSLQFSRRWDRRSGDLTGQVVIIVVLPNRVILHWISRKAIFKDFSELLTIRWVVDRAQIHLDTLAFLLLQAVFFGNVFRHGNCLGDDTLGVEILVKPLRPLALLETTETSTLFKLTYRIIPPLQVKVLV